MPSVASIDYGFIKSCFLQATRREEFQNKWMSADTWAKLIAKYCITDSTLTFNGTNLDKCLSLRQNEHLRTQMDMRKGTTEDHIGIFREVLRKHGKQRTYYYYATKQGQLPILTETMWYDNISEAEDLLNIVITKSKASKSTISLNTGLRPTKKRKQLPKEEVGLQASATQAPENHNGSSEGAICVPSASHALHCPLPDEMFDYWCSPEAKILFSPRNGEPTQQSIREQVEILTKTNENDTAYLNVVVGGREIDDGTMSNNQKHCIHQKCQLLCVAINVALENMNGWTWESAVEWR